MQTNLAEAEVREARKEMQFALAAESLDSPSAEEDSILREIHPESLELRKRLLEIEERAKLLELSHDAIFVQDRAGRVVYWNRGAQAMYDYTAEEAIGRLPQDLLRTEFPTPPKRIERELREYGRWSGELVQTTRSGQRIVVASRRVMRYDPAGRARGVLEIDNDITLRKRNESRLIQQRRRLTEVLNMVPGYVVIKDADCQIRFANEGFVKQFPMSTDRPCYEVQHGYTKPCSTCQVRDILDSGESRDWEWTTPEGLTFHVWSYPFTDMDGTPAVLELGIDVTDQKEALRMVTEISERERRHIGRELHDSLGQKLTGLGFLAQSVSGPVKDMPGRQGETVSRIVDLAAECVSEIRAFARGLDPVGLDANGLQAALRELCSGVAELHDLSCPLEVETDLDMSDSVAVNLYRIAQEALTNAAKHSDADEVKVTLGATDDGGLALEVIDDGDGYDLQWGEGLGMGLRTMRFRAEVMGARLDIAKAGSRGTRVTCSVPPQRLLTDTEGRS